MLQSGHGSRDRRTDGRTDGRSETNTPQQLRCSGGIIIRNHNRQWNLKENMRNSVTISVLADGLAPLGIAIFMQCWTFSGLHVETKFQFPLNSWSIPLMSLSHQFFVVKCHYVRFRLPFWIMLSDFKVWSICFTWVNALLYWILHHIWLHYNGIKL